MEPNLATLQGLGSPIFSKAYSRKYIIWPQSFQSPVSVLTGDKPSFSHGSLTSDECKVPLRSNMTFQVPCISQAEIESFQTSHFSTAAIASFSMKFLPTGSTLDAQYDQSWPCEHDCTEREYYEEEEDDGLGYYPDGVKRTLTDEQIEIFRHSELESLRRAQEKATKLREQSADMIRSAQEIHAYPDEMVGEGILGDNATMQPSRANRSEAYSGSEDGELDEDDLSQHNMTEAEAKRLKKKRARQRKKERSKKFHPEPKPDLRKRTWDVVEAGMDSLDYDGFAGPDTTNGGLASKRRQISYDD